MSIEGTRRVMETTSHETANQYLRFGWSLINHYVVEATPDTPAMVKYVLASVRRLEDTHEVLTLGDPDEVNAHLQLGWKLIEKYVAGSRHPDRRDEVLHFVLAWQREETPLRPGDVPPAPESADAAVEIDDELW
ncbi:MAG: hypothetical protein DWQ37_09735 [Planctomycetota bacterium]|nr:MAG: hypothetical protein DWQ37_09735 [Planctomycetota bacterium]